MKAHISKTLTGWVPACEKAAELHRKQKIGEVSRVEIKGIRNYQFLKKYFALLTIAFDNWEPGEINSKYGVPQKNFDRFRENCTIKAGYYYMVIELDGSSEFKAKSISFDNMDEETFAELYSKTIDVLLEYVYGSEMTKEEIDKIVELYLSFA